ncbi:MAG TPA: SDR family NAD(P)-dependent oxidoreductase [Stellaceae bacterium]|nr:SDR family NAD(P)-dependent oxidoreductase [Stellaceae bacterium]
MTGVLDGQSAIVTGGARGIGLGIARHLASQGCRIVLWDLDFGGKAESDWGFQPALVQTVDVSDPAVVERAFAKTRETLPRIDILVNNAGINGPIAEVPSYPLTAWDRVIAVDLNSVFYCCRTVVPHMREIGYGRIVNIASIAGKEGTPGVAAYCAAKAGVIGFSKALAREVVKAGITVNCVAPAMAVTELLQQMTPKHIEEARAKIPMGRFCTVEEIAATVAWIASPACSFTTGAVFDISGGRASY